MKKYITIAALISIYQYGYSQKIQWQPTAGINIDMLHFDKWDLAKESPGFKAGIYLDTKIKKNISFETGLFYSRANGNITRFLFGYPIDILIKEKYHLDFIKIPALVVIKQKKNHPFSAGIGIVVKYNLHSYRSSYVPEWQERYSGSFTIDTKSGDKTGLCIQFITRKEFQINKSRFSAGLYLDSDLTQWQYPTSFFEPDSYYPFRSTDLSLMLAMIL